jgi:peptidoglycan/LPS O-acetylase OafA/YrhL
MARTSPTLPPLDHESQLRADPVAAPAEISAREGGVAERASWGSAVAALGILMILAGLALTGFPFLLDYSSEAAGANSIACGAIVLFLGILRLVGMRHALVGLAALGVGAWLFAASFFVGELPREAWGQGPLGVAVFLLGLLGLARPTPDPARGAASSDLR